jgi:hypothetical protein
MQPTTTRAERRISMSTNSAAVTRTNADGKLLFVCKHCDESIGYPTGSSMEKLVHLLSGDRECHPTTTAEKKLVELANVQPHETYESYMNPTPSFNDVVRELTTYMAEPHRSPSGKAQGQHGCKNCGQDIYWNSSQWTHWSSHPPFAPRQCDGAKVAAWQESK